jgi:hypothetical protein
MENNYYVLVEDGVVVLSASEPQEQGGFIEAPYGTIAGYTYDGTNFFPPPKPLPPAPSEELMEMASVFRLLLRLHFGENAETNTNITEKTVIRYFIERRLNGTSEQNDASDGILLQKGFDAIISYTQDGTIWSFPWDLIN